MTNERLKKLLAKALDYIIINGRLSLEDLIKELSLTTEEYYKIMEEEK